MKDYNIQGETLRDIADAIREKTGSNEPMEVKNMAENISRISGAAEPVLQEKEVIPSEEEQVVIPDNGFDGLSRVDVQAIPSNYEDVTEETNELVTKINSLEESLNLLSEELDGKCVSGGVELLTFKYNGGSMIEPNSRIFYLDKDMVVQIVEFDTSKTYTAIKNSICIAEGVTDNNFENLTLFATLGMRGVYQVTESVVNDGATDEDDEVMDVPW